MNAKMRCNKVSGTFTLLLLAGFLALADASNGAEDTKFDVLQVGTQTYTNVTVTTKAKKYIFILHSTGMANIPVASLTPDQRIQLGYQSTQDRAKVQSATAANWVKEKALAVPQVKAAEEQIHQTIQEQASTTLPRLQSDPKMMFLVLGAGFLLYLFFCNCNRLICEKTGNKAGPWIWVPFFQIFPMLRAASMSGWWVLAFLVPVLNIIAPIVWCFKIAKARGKSPWVGFALLLPVVGFFAYLYLAFSDGVQMREKQVVEVMCLETA